jgi:hypothetical protein
MSIDATREFETLLRNFVRDMRTAISLKSPNSEDSLDIRVAIVGFSYNSATEQWGRNHYQYVREHSSQDAEIPEPERAFHALCLGYLLGLFQAEKISENEFSNAENQLAGFVLLKAGNIA